jgi:hypothetical protein
MTSQSSAKASFTPRADTAANLLPELARSNFGLAAHTTLLVGARAQGANELPLFVHMRSC